jgi:hypothetical protein
MPIDKAIELFKDHMPEDYTAKFIRLRDYTFLSEAKKIIEANLFYCLL